MNKKLKVLLITGIVTNEHDPKAIPMLRFLLESTGRFQVKVTEEFRGCTGETLEGYDLLFLVYDGKETVETPFVSWGRTAERALYDFVANGGGCVVFHSSCMNSGANEFPEEFVKLVGYDFGFHNGLRKSPKIECTIHTCAGAHPIVEGCPKVWNVVQEDFFVNMTQIDPDITVLATVRDDLADYDPDLFPEHRRKELEGMDFSTLPDINEEVPVAWVHHYGKGRVMGVSIGHGPDTIRRPNFTGLIARGSEWCASGKITIPYPNLDGWKRINAWPYYNDITWQEFSRLTSF